MKCKKEATIFFFFLFVCFYFEDTLYALLKYTVKSGDTFWEISLMHGMNLESLLRANPQVKNPNLIYPGQTLFLPVGQQGRSNVQNRMLQLLNDERRKAGLQSLQMDEKLAMVAEKKSIDMKDYKYVAHNSPTFGNPTVMLATFKIPHNLVLENIGAGPKTAEEMFQTWKNSQVNRNKILENKATHVGIGYEQGGVHGHYWTMLIILKKQE